MSVKVILADDHEQIRYAQRCILEGEAEVEIIAEAANGRELLQRVAQLGSDIVIMDINMPEINGIEATRRLRQSHPDVKVIGFSLYATSAMILNMLNAGAWAYVSKKCAVNELGEAIRAVVKGQRYISPSICGAAIREIRRKDQKEAQCPSHDML